MNLLLAGGDRRMLALRLLLQNDGHEVHTIGLVEGDAATADPSAADALIFAWPFSAKNGLVPTITGEQIRPEELLGSTRPGTAVIGGRGLEDWHFLKRYESVEAFNRANASISAEATVFEVMLRADRALNDLKILVTGYGLFGSAAAQKLKVLGADVWIAARRAEMRKQAELDGLRACSMEDMGERLSDTDFVLNTVPAPVLGERELRKLKKGAWVLEAASAPYGFNRDMATALGLNAVLLPGLPARYAPQSAAKALHAAVRELLKEEAG